MRISAINHSCSFTQQKQTSKNDNNPISKTGEKAKLTKAAFVAGLGLGAKLLFEVLDGEFVVDTLGDQAEKIVSKQHKNATKNNKLLLALGAWTGLVMAFIGENAPTTEQESTMQRVDIETIKSTFSQEEITEMRNQNMGFQEPPKFEVKYHEALNAKLNEIRQAAQKLKNRIKDPKEKKKKFDVIDKFIKKVKNDAKIYNEENLMSEEVYESFVKQTLDQMQGVFGDLFKRDSIKVKPEEEK